MCVCILALVTQQANHILSVPYYIVKCGMSGSTIFFHVISQTALFSKQTKIEHEMCVLILSASFVWNISHSKNNSTRYYHLPNYLSVCLYIYTRLHVNSLLILRDFNQPWIFPCGHADEQTDMTQFIVTFHNFANMLKSLSGTSISAATDHKPNTTSHCFLSSHMQQ